MTFVQRMVKKERMDLPSVQMQFKFCMQEKPNLQKRCKNCKFGCEKLDACRAGCYNARIKAGALLPGFVTGAVSAKEMRRIYRNR